MSSFEFNDEVMDESNDESYDCGYGFDYEAAANEANDGDDSLDY